MRNLFLFLATCAATGGAFPAEIATGKMLGAGYEARSFYVRKTGAAWQKTCTGRQFRPEAAGADVPVSLLQAGAKREDHAGHAD